MTAEIITQVFSMGLERKNCDVFSGWQVTSALKLEFVVLGVFMQLY